MTAQDEGRQFEEEWAKDTGAKKQPGSGNKWFALMDNKHIGKVLWSLKATRNQSLNLKKKDLEEVRNAVNGPGGLGGETIPGMALKIDGDKYVVFRAEDYLKLLEQEVRFIEPDKATQRIAKAKIPSILKDT